MENPTVTDGPERAIAAAQAGDADAFATLVAPLERQLRSYLHRLCGSPDDAADLCQDTLLKAFQQVPTFRGDASFRTWLFRIASNTAIDYLRARRRWDEAAQDQAKRAAIADPGFLPTVRELVATSPHARFEVQEHVSHCFTCVAKTLPPDQQLALLLRDVYDFSDADGARVLDKTEAAFKHLVHGARRTMSAIYERRCALVSKQGACWQCRELAAVLHGADEADRQVNERAVRDLAATDDSLARRAALVRGVDPLAATGTDLHALLLRQLRAANRYD